MLKFKRPLAALAISGLAFAAEVNPAADNSGPQGSVSPAPNTTVTTTTAAPAASGVIGAVDFRPTYNTTNGAVNAENYAQRGYRFSIHHVTAPRTEPRELADRGVRSIKVPAALLLDQRSGSTSHIHPSDLSDLLGRFGIDLIAERIEGERAVVDLLDYDVRFGQGFLFAPPRPLRPEGASATGGAPPNTAQEPNGPPKTAPLPGPAIEPPARTTGNAALARRAAGPG